MDRPARHRAAGFAVCWLVALVAPSPAGAGAEPPAAGDRAPAFSLPGSDGAQHSLAASVGKRGVVLAWFPKAFTGG